MPGRGPHYIVAGACALAILMMVFCGGLIIFLANKPQKESSGPLQSATPSVPPANPNAIKQSLQASSENPEVDNVTAADIFGTAAPLTGSQIPSINDKPILEIKPSALDVDDRSVRVPTFREWNARAGGFKVNAKFVKMVGGQVELAKQAKGTANVPIEKLSQVDVEYVKDLIRVHLKANVIIGKALAAASGNSVLLNEEGEQKFIQLYGIAPPEPGQEFYREAKESLSNKIVGKHVWVEWFETNKESNPIGVIYSDCRNINLELVADGVVWHDVRVSNDRRMANAEFIAREKRLGLWKQPNPTAPWAHN